MTKLKAQKTDRSMSLISAICGDFSDKKKKHLVDKMWAYSQWNLQRTLCL